MPGGERVLVEHVAADDPGAAVGQRPLGGVGAGERDDLVAALGEPARERPADQAAPAGEEDAAHAGRSPRVSAGTRGRGSPTADHTVIAAAASIAHSSTYRPPTGSPGPQDRERDRDELDAGLELAEHRRAP